MHLFVKLIFFALLLFQGYYWYPHTQGINFNVCKCVCLAFNVTITSPTDERQLIERWCQQGLGWPIQAQRNIYK